MAFVSLPSLRMTQGVLVRMAISRARWAARVMACSETGKSGEVGRFLFGVVMIRSSPAYGSVLINLFLQPDLDQRWVGHVSRVGGSLDGFQQVQGQA
jgi:hypothetical protein